MSVTPYKVYPRKNIDDILYAQINNIPPLKKTIKKRGLNLIMKDQRLSILIVIMMIKILKKLKTRNNPPTKTKSICLLKERPCILKKRKH